jgi:TonB family protein
MDARGRYFDLDEARRIVGLLRAGALSEVPPHPELFAAPSGPPRRAKVPLLLSGTLHGTFLAAAIALTSLGLTADSSTEMVETPEPMRLVFLALPGPGGGGGGGGLKQRTPPPKAERKGDRKLSSPIPERKAPDPVVAAPTPPPPKPAVLNAESLPPVVAPVVAAPADPEDKAGDLKQTASTTPSRGPGDGGGVGTGAGTGIGEGQGSGIGPGSGGGTGGGPYRPGSGIAPPRLIREVKADYTEEARQRNVEGEVVLEIVIRHDGTVGDVKILKGLASGLNQKAIDAVRQWRFSPARRLGQPVDVIVEVSVEFKLR